MKYHVTLKYPNIEVTVEADSVEEAMELAVEEADDNYHFSASEWAGADVTEANPL